MNAVELLIAMLLGIIASLMAWWILTHSLVPKILFAPFISKVKVKGKEDYKFRIGIRNIGNRDIIDVEIIIELIIKGFDKDVPSNTSYIQLKLNKPRLPKIKKKNQWALTINTTNLPNSLLPVYKNKNFEDLLRIENAEAKIVVFGYDRFSGTRKVFESKHYTINDIEEKLFEKKYYGKYL